MVLRKLLLVLTLFFTFVAFANEEDSSTEKNQGDKITFLYIDESNCHYCRMLDKMLQEGRPAELLQQYFIIKRVVLDENLELPEGLPLPYGTPTVYFLDANDQALIEPMRGKKTEEELIWFLEEAIAEKDKGRTLWDKLFGK